MTHKAHETAAGSRRHLAAKPGRLESGDELGERSGAEDVGAGLVVDAGDRTPD